VENKAWAANYDEKFGPFVNKYKEFMAQVSYPHACGPVGGLLVFFLCRLEFSRCRGVKDDCVIVLLFQMAVLYQNAKDKHTGGLEMLKKHFDYHPEFKRWSDTFSAVPFRPK